MNRFWETIIEPALTLHQPRVIVEIGSEFGRNTEHLLAYGNRHDATLHTVDPHPKFDFAAWERVFAPRFIFYQERSLDALPKIGPADAVLIDGDHNWYTVSNELQLIAAAAREHGCPLPLVFLHDVGWPYGRRDLYYDPAAIPPELRQPYLKQGMDLDQPELLASGGFNAHVHNATREGGPRNGVLTAIEDFLEEASGAYEVVLIPGLQGLGVLIPTASASAAPLRALLGPFSQPEEVPRFLERLERDRNELQVRAAEIAQRHQAEKERVAQQGSLPTEERTLREELERRLNDVERQLDVYKDLLRASEERQRDESEFVRQTFEELRTQRASLEAEIAKERSFLRAQLAEERDLVRTDLAGERERLRAEAETRERQRAIQEEEQLRRFKTAVDAALRREEALTQALLAATARLTRADALLSRLENRVPSKKGLQTLAATQNEIAAIGQILRGGQSSSAFAHTPTSANGPLPYDPNRILPGRPPLGGLSVISPNGREQRQLDEPTARADVVVCMHNAPEDVTRCLASLAQHTDSRHGVIVVDDGSDEATAAVARDAVERHPGWTLLRNDEAAGYTRAANQGLRQSAADVVVLLNSDTIVTPGWLERLLECAESDPAIGIVGPLSNAASYQSAPELVGPDGDWSLNPLPPQWEIDHVGAAVAQVSRRSFPRVPFVNGFCLAIKRAVVDAIGYFDEAAFPHGYGEENDYCLRAADAGFALAIADHAYVHHAKSRSYSHERRRELGREGRKTLLQRYDAARIRSAEALLRADPDLARMRQLLAERLAESPPIVDAPSVLFLLPVSGGGGGAHSIAQEAAGMRRLGVRAQVAVQAKHLQHYRNTYADLEDAASVFLGYDTLDDLATFAAEFSVVVATINTSVPDLAMIATAHPTILPAYYVQDYEPYFFPAGSLQREAAAASYTLLPDAVLFAKTQWLCDLVSGMHGVPVHKVSPSLDHAVFYPPESERGDERLRVAAMIRPRSARRGAPRTMMVLRRLAAEFGKAIDVHIFGCGDAEIAAAGLASDFRYENHGILGREDVADLLRTCDVFLDLSDYQAFGRTGLEAMACGCAVAVPALGGASEYAVHRENAMIVDTSSIDACYEVARELVADATLRERLQRAALATAREYSIERAARSEIEVFQSVRPEIRLATVTDDSPQVAQAYG